MAPRGAGQNASGVERGVTCETGPMSERPLVLATLEGYAVEGGFDRAHEPTTCYKPTIALGRHEGPGDAEGLWDDYERVIDVAATLSMDGLRLNVEWARVEPRRGEVNALALERYVQVARYATSLGLNVTVAIVDAAWPSWLGLEAWLLPWVVPCVLSHTRRVAASMGDAARRIVVFTDPDALIANGYLNELAPPWRQGASDDAASARKQIDDIERMLRDDAEVGPKMVGATRTVSLDLSYEQIREERRLGSECEEIYVRSLVKGVGPTAALAAVLERRGSEWSLGPNAALLSALTS
jgi:beta-glucosidase/6-phospho-beta-glucosidase/beta-galactosidase